MLVLYIFVVWYCGGCFCYFFWFFIVFFIVGLWLFCKIVVMCEFCLVFDVLFGWLLLCLVEDICCVKFLIDWFFFVVLFKGFVSGVLFMNVWDGFWNFVVGLRLLYYFWFGFWGFVGMVVWMFIFFFLLIVILFLFEGLVVLCGFFGVILMLIVLVYVLFV